MFLGVTTMHAQRQSVKGTVTNSMITYVIFHEFHIRICLLSLIDLTKF
jgi:hypothetical protein